MVDALQRAWFQTITITAELCKKKKGLTNFDFVVRGPESLAQPCLTPEGWGGGGGYFAYERGGDARVVSLRGVTEY